MRNRLGLGGVIGALLRRPGLWVEALRMLGATRHRRRPWPSVAYLRWRSHTAYGEVVPIHPDDLVAFLTWRRAMRTSISGRRSR